MPKVVDHDAMRASLAKQCVDAFASHGYGNISMRTLAEAAGTSTGSLYHYFGSKAGLFRQVVAVVSEQDISEGTRLLVGAIPDPRERLEPLLQFVFAQSTRLANHFRVIAEFAIHPDNPGEEWLALMQGSRARYLDALRSALEIEDEAKLDMVLLTICGLTLRSMCGDPTTSVEPVVGQLRKVLW